MANPKSWEREFIEDGAMSLIHDGQLTVTGPLLTDEQKAMHGELQKLSAEMKRRKKHEKWSPAENQLYREEQLFKITADFYTANEARAERLKRDAEKVKAEYEKKRNPTQEALSLHRYELEFNFMDKADVEKAALDFKFHGNSPAWTEDRVRVLKGMIAKHEIKDVDIEGLKSTHKTTEPWRHEEPAIYKALELYTSEYGVANVLNDLGDVQRVEIAKIFDDGE